jgi:hypothetical protein
MQENPEPGIPLWFPPRVENPLQGLLEDLLRGDESKNYRPLVGSGT